MDGVVGPRKLSEGTMLDDKYRIERLLATGGMGAVYLGTHTRLRKRVAIKILDPQLSTTPMLERFHREAITASQIGHEGIAQVTDLGNSHDGEPFLVMEYLEGESLASRLHALGPLAIEDACELGCAILSPLSAAHRAGIVHRDLKPDNVFLVRQSRGEIVKLLDFGISRSVGHAPEFRLTNTGIVLGTPYYMSPEQARGESQITPAADLYAFGVILYETLVGDVPIRAENYNQLMYRVTIGEFDRPRDRRPEIPEGLEQIILHAMAQSPEDRPASAADLEQALLAFCRPVFREHASGRISAPGLSFKTPPGGNRVRSSSDDLDDHARFAGPTVSTASDTFRGGLLLPEETGPLAAAGKVPEHDAPPRPTLPIPQLVAASGPRPTLPIPQLVAASGPQPTLPIPQLVAASGPQPALPVSQPVAASGPQPALPVSQLVAASGPQPALPVSPPVVQSGSQPALPVFASPAPRRSLVRRILTGFALVAVSAAAAATLVIGLAGRDTPSIAMPTLPSLPAVPAAPSTRANDGPGVLPAAQPPTAPGASARATGESPAAQAPATVTLWLAITPPGAAITLDGARVSGPELVVHKDAGLHRLRITAAGYLAYDEAISLDMSERLVVQLKRTAGASHAKDPRRDPHSKDRPEPIEGPGKSERTSRTEGIDSNSPYEHRSHE